MPFRVRVCRRLGSCEGITWGDRKCSLDSLSQNKTLIFHSISFGSETRIRGHYKRENKNM